MLEAGLDDARGASHAFTLAQALTWTSVFHQIRGDVVTAAGYAEELIELCEAHVMPLFLGVGELARAWCNRGEPGSLEAARSGVERAAATGNQAAATQILAVLAEVNLASGRAEDAAALVHLALELSDQMGMRFWNAPLLLLAGRLALMREERMVAVDQFRRSAGVAGRQGAVLFELAALCDLVQADPSKDADWMRLGELLAAVDGRDESLITLEARRVIAGH